MKKRAAQSADGAIRMVDELLSGKKLQRSTRGKLITLRRELIELRQESDVGKCDVAILALRWATVVVKLQELLSHLFD